ncbi:MFS transporter [Sediminicoccus sp. KRV36]|uniref:MFS transporter n=1 Tax=Sediminicoccus sp. KRV36 TaxID=3133721 RepID=UPI00200BAF8A|nr:MFS transporter [Sediminicoccus rosea]UPY35811.1 MFS transporter [Sediminicoccus rosea]
MLQPTYALMGVNFFMADLRDGFGPFLGVFLQLNGWTPAGIGLVNTLGGLAAMAAMIPLGLLLDETPAKRGVLVLSVTGVILACGAVFLAPDSGLAAASRMGSGMAGAAIGPAIAAITLGIMGQGGYPRQVGRNQASNHAGNVAAALLAGLLGYLYGLPGVFGLLVLNGALGLLALLLIRARDIDHAVARGLASDGGAPASTLRALVASPALLVLASTVFLFHLGNAAMTPLLGQMIVARGTAGDPMAYTAATVIISQGTMILTALLAAWLAVRRGYNIVFLIALTALPLRGLTSGLIESPWVVVPAQILDGFGNGMMGVAVPGLVVRIMQGSGHVAAGMGAVLTTWAVGSALSALLGGIVAGQAGYSAAYFTLAGIASLALLLWVLAWPLIGQAAQRQG